MYVAWQGYMAYADRFDSDDLAFRAVYFAAMLAIAAMAILIDDVAHGANSGALAVAYVCLRSLMLALYWRAWRAVPDARPLIRRYGVGYGMAVGIWLVLLAFEPPFRYVVWGIALALELSLPPLSTRLHRLVPTHGSHLPERWALFTLIVFGESVVAVARETSDASWRLDSATAAVLGFTSVAAVWWLYFDRQAAVALQGTSPAPLVYSSAHLPLLIGLGATSAGVRLLIERAGEDHLGAGASAALLGGVLLYLLSLVVTRSVTVTGPRRVGVSLKIGAAAVILGLLLAQRAFSPVGLAAGLAMVLVAVVFAERTLIPPSQSAS